MANKTQQKKAGATIQWVATQGPVKKSAPVGRAPAPKAAKVAPVTVAELAATLVALQAEITALKGTKAATVAQVRQAAKKGKATVKRGRGRPASKATLLLRARLQKDQGTKHGIRANAEYVSWLLGQKAASPASVPVIVSREIANLS